MKLAYDCRVFPKYTLGQLICFSICGHVPSLVGLKPRELLIDLVYTCSMTTMITTMKDSGLPSTWLRARSLTLPSWLLPHHREITLMLGILTSKDLVSVKIFISYWIPKCPTLSFVHPRKKCWTRRSRVQHFFQG